MYWEEYLFMIETLNHWDELLTDEQLEWMYQEYKAESFLNEDQTNYSLI